MIIWGWTVRHRTLGEGEFHCPACGRETAYQHKQAAQYFTLYFVPLFRTEDLGEYVKCLGCGGEYTTEVLSYRAPTDDERMAAVWEMELATGTPLEMVRRKIEHAGAPTRQAEEMTRALAGADCRWCSVCSLTYAARVERCTQCGVAVPPGL